MTPIIKAANITKNYGQQEVLKGIDLLIAPGDFTCIMGRSGCGKTTLLKILGLMHPPTTGDVFFEERLTHELFPDEISDRTCCQPRVFQTKVSDDSQNSYHIRIFSKSL